MDQNFFRDNIFKYVPRLYRRTEDDVIIPALYNLLAPLLDEIHQLTFDFPELANIDKVPPQFLQNLANLLAFSFEEGTSSSQRRIELGKVVDVYKKRSTVVDLNRVLKYSGSTVYGVFQPFHSIMFLDQSPMDGNYFMEDASYWRPGTLDIYSNQETSSLLPRLLDNLPVGTRLYTSFILTLYFAGSIGAGSYQCSNGYAYSYSNVIDTPLPVSVFNFTRALTYEVPDREEIVDWSSNNFFFNQGNFVNFSKIGVSVVTALKYSQVP